LIQAPKSGGLFEKKTDESIFDIQMINYDGMPGFNDYFNTIISNSCPVSVKKYRNEKRILTAHGAYEKKYTHARTHAHMYVYTAPIEPQNLCCRAHTQGFCLSRLKTRKNKTSNRRYNR